MSELLAVGTRVRHYYEQYPRAQRDGTGNIIEVRDIGTRVEYLVERDEPLIPQVTVGDWISQRRSWWAADATISVTY